MWHHEKFLQITKSIESIENQFDKLKSKNYIEKGNWNQK